MNRQRIAVLGLGGGGSRMAAALGQLDRPGPAMLDVAAADTDLRALEGLDSVTCLELGREWTREQGCGGDAVLGERAASASVDALRGFMADARLLLVVAGLGGGTGSGAVKVVARLCREAEQTAIFLVTLPFAFEGNWRRREAEEALTPLRELADTVIVIPNDILFTALPADTSAKEAFTLADALLAKALAGLARITSAEGLITADLASLRGLLRHRQATCLLGVGEGEGESRWQGAMEAFFDCPLVGGREALANGDAAVLTLVGGADLSVGEIQACLMAFQQHFRPDVRLVVGAYTDASLAGRLQITGLVCLYAEAEPAVAVAAAAERGRAQPPNLRDRSRAREVQQELPLQEQTLGVFSGSSPTTVRGENLDIPTYQRRGIELDIG